MDTIPKPQKGTVFRYRYLRVESFVAGEQVGKERPCCVILPLKSGAKIYGARILDEQDGARKLEYVAADGDVMVLLIQTDPPNADQEGIELTPDDKRYVGLNPDSPSHVIVSELNIDRWPNGDMCLIPGKDKSFVYDRPFAGPTMARIAQKFLEVYRDQAVQILVRTPTI